ncbi:aminoglycoside phosphotransferase family protein [Nakamurella sp. GG22]
MEIPQGYLDQPRWWHGGADWLAALPALVDASLRRWELTVDQGAGGPWHGSNALVVPVLRDGERLVLRLAPPDPATTKEVAALRFWDGRGTVRLIQHDSAAAAMLLERIVPGTPASSRPVGESMIVVGTVLRRMTVPAPAPVHGTDRIAADLMSSLALDWERLGRPFPRSVLSAAQQTALALSATVSAVAVNGDLHADQVLQATREPWLVVDPVLLRGDPEYDLARVLWTRLDEMPDDAAILAHLDTLVRTAELDDRRALAWARLRTIDYWLWGLSAGLTEDPVRCARLAAALGW